MSSYASLKLSNGKRIDWYRNYLSEEMMSLFNDCDLKISRNGRAIDVDKVQDFEEYLNECGDEENTFTYEVTADIMRKRLMVYGYCRESLNDVLEDASCAIKEYETEAGGYSVYLQLLRVGKGEKVILDVTDLVYGGWLTRDMIKNKVDGLDNPLIVGEGVNDMLVLKGSLRVLFPEIVDNIDFLDLSFKPEGSAASVVKMAKSFASAHIPKRTLFLLDNDSAARDAALNIKKFKLPNNIRILHYPDIDFCKDYPTIGPQGKTNMNINGLAGSIELYFGKNILTGSNGELEPIQWTGYIERVGGYQGVIMNKDEINKRFKRILKGKNNNQLAENLGELKKLWGFIFGELEQLKR